MASAVPTAPHLKCFYLRGLQTSCRYIGDLFFFFPFKDKVHCPSLFSSAH